MVGIGDLPGGAFRSGAGEMNERDLPVLAGGGSSARGPEAFLWKREQGMVGLGDLPGGIFDSAAGAVSWNGAVITGRGASTLGYEAFRWTPMGGMLGLGDLPGGIYQSTAHGVTADGWVVVGEGTGPTTYRQEAFIWDSLHGLRNLRDVLMNDHGLNLTAWVSRIAFDISPGGSAIVGVANGPSGGEAFLARIPPFCYADCDESTGPRTLDLFDFLCFQNAFAGGCP